MVVVEGEVYKCDICNDTIVCMDEYETYFKKPVTEETTYLHTYATCPGYGSKYDTIPITLHFCEQCMDEMVTEEHMDADEYFQYHEKLIEFGESNKS